MSKYPCTGCGMCCRNVGIAVSSAKRMIVEGNTDSYVDEVAAFPFPVDDQGACVNLLPDNKCAVYDNRPDICDIEKTWEKHHSPNISKENFFLSTMFVCNKMMMDGGANSNFFITIPEHDESTAVAE